jgi:hypothetical protein
MHIVYMGAEVPGWYKLLSSQGVENFGVSYNGLRKRLPKTKEYRLSEHLPEGRIFLDSGGFTANKEPDSHTLSEWREYNEEYITFVEKNIDAIDTICEFDCLALGPNFMREMREEFWDSIPRDKFLPIWHEAFGIKSLEALAEKYPRVGVTDATLKGSLNLTPRLNQLVQKYDTKLHGIAMTKPDELRNIKFDSVSSTSWLSPSKYGDTIVWDTNKLVRYPVAYKEQSRLRHSALFTRAGFDAEKIRQDDSTEVLKFTIWSWTQLENSLNKRGNLTLLSDKRDEVEEPPKADIDGDTPINSALEVLNKGGSVNRGPERREDSDYRLLPVLQFKDMEITKDDGTTAIEQVAMVNSRSMRVCDSCALSDVCPEFRPGFECAYKFPIELRTPADYKQAMDGLLEAQMGRAMFGKMSEDMRGGYPDPNVSQEFDRFFKMAKLAKEIQDSGNYVKITAEGRGAGVFSKFFGNELEQKVNPQPLESKNKSETDLFLGGIIDAEVIEGEKS